MGGVCCAQDEGWTGMHYTPLWLKNMTGSSSQDLVCDDARLRSATTKLDKLLPQLPFLTPDQEKAFRRLEGATSVYRYVKEKREDVIDANSSKDFSKSASTEYWRAYALSDAHRAACDPKAESRKVYQDLKDAFRNNENGEAEREALYQYLQTRAEFEAYLALPDLTWPYETKETEDSWVSLFREVSRKLVKMEPKKEVVTPMGKYSLVETPIFKDHVYRCTKDGNDKYVIKFIHNTNKDWYNMHRDLLIPREAALTGFWRPGQVIDWGETGSGKSMFLITRYLGSTLRALPEKLPSEINGANTVRDEEVAKIKLIKQVAKKMVTSLSELAKWNIAHRDLKPDNIVYDTKKDVHFIDFGLAKADHVSNPTKAPMGSFDKSVSYMPPEVWSNRMEKKWKEELSPRHDPFSLAVTLLVIYKECLSKGPFKEGAFDTEPYGYKEEVDEIRTHDEDLGNFLRDALMTDANERSSIYQMHAVTEAW